MILLGLNEINFPFVERYIKSGQLLILKNFKNGLIKTNSEKDYYLLEPWIQWVTVFTGLSYNEHKVFRLGDIVNRKDLIQIFEKLEKNLLKLELFLHLMLIIGLNHQLFLYLIHGLKHMLPEIS